MDMLDKEIYFQNLVFELLTEATFVISRERFEESVSPFLEKQEDDYEISNRPREGDLIFSPLGKKNV